MFPTSRVIVALEFVGKVIAAIFSITLATEGFVEVIVISSPTKNLLLTFINDIRRKLGVYKFEIVAVAPLKFPETLSPIL